jgi:hypothetical protein
LVSQTGANSITNPDGNFQAEFVHIGYDETSAEPELAVEQNSGLLGSGETVLAWADGYAELAGLLDAASLAYEAYYADEQALDLDFEWKHVAPGMLVVKQIRRIPRLSTAPPPIIK